MPNDASILSREDRLTTWKEIAAFLGRDERTAKRWEVTRGLPVRRVPGGRSTVYALRSELEAWLARAPAEEETPPPPGSADAAIAPAAPVRPRRGVVALAGFALAGIIAGTAWLERPAARSSPGGAPELYTRGLYLMNTRTRAGLEGAIADFSKLILFQPDYAPAYAGLASSYNLMPEFAGMPPGPAFAQARIAARRAIDLDPDLAEAQRSLGFADFWGAHNVRAARAAFERAIRLDPKDATSRHWYANVLTMLGDEKEALRQFALAERLDPTSTAIRVDYANSLAVAGRLEEARDRLDAVISARPDYAWAETVLARVEMARGDLGGAVDAMTRAAATSGDHDGLVVAEAARRGLAEGGEAGLRRAVLRAQEALYAKGGYSPFELAVSLAAVDPDRAISLLEAGARSGDASVMGARADIRLKALHANPRFQALLAQLGLSPARRA